MTYTKSVLSLLLMLLFFVSCENDDDDESPVSSNQSAIIKAEVTANLQNGNWRVFKMIDSGQNETQDFNGYIFTFQSNGVVSAVKNNTTYNGNWNITDSDSNDDSQDDLDFNLNFSQPPSFSDLNDDWDFISQSASKIELIDISGGNGGIDSLTFVKN